MTSEREQAGSVRIVATIQRALPNLVMARDLMDRFRGLIQRRKSVGLETCIAEAASSLLASFASGHCQRSSGGCAGRFAGAVVERQTGGQNPS
jgi:hypothetical protein